MALADVTFEGIAWPRQSFQIKCEGILIDIISMTAHDSGVNWLASREHGDGIRQCRT